MKLFQKDELKLLWPFYLNSIISSMLFILPAFYVIYFVNLDFNMFQIGVLLSMAPLFALLFEIPTGAIADIYGRKFSVLLGIILQGIIIFFMFVSSDFYIIALLFALMGIGSTFISGANEAWTTDLINKNKKSLLQGFFAKITSFNAGALVISGLLGSFLVKQFGLIIIWPVSGISFFVSFAILVFAKEEFTKKNTNFFHSLKKIKNQSVKSLSYTRKHPVLFYFLMTSLILVIAGSFGSEISWIPLLKNMGFPEHAFGYLWSAMTAIGMIAPLTASFLSKKGKEKSFILTVMIILMLITLLVIFVYTLIPAIIILLLSLFFIYLPKPIERTFFHRYIPSKLRATIGSIESMMLSIAAIIAAPLAGLSVDHLGPKTTIFLSAILMIPAIIVFSKIQGSKPQP